MIKTPKIEFSTTSLNTEPYTPTALANAYIDLAVKTRTPLNQTKLQSLVYLTYAWSLALGYPTCRGTAYAWNFGPVFKGLYQILERHKGHSITKPLTDTDVLPKGQPETQTFIQEVWEKHKPFASNRLMVLTQDSAWSQYWHDATTRFKPIPNELIRHVYQIKLQPLFDKHVCFNLPLR